MTRTVVSTVIFSIVMLSIAHAARDTYDEESTLTWRATKDTELSAPDGWLSVAGLAFLRPGVNTIGTGPGQDIVLPAGSAPARAGRLTYVDGRVFLDLERGVTATIDNVPVRARVELRTADPASRRPADRVVFGRVSLQLHASGSRLGVRLRDPDNPLRREFTGRRWFPIDTQWVIRGRFVPYDAPRVLAAHNVLGDDTPTTSPGEVQFELAGTTYRFVTYGTRARLSIVFDTATATPETYRFRFLPAHVLEDGSVALDFNRAYNPPCAFNPYTTCVMPPPGNRLATAIRAGERLHDAEPIPAASRR